MSYLYKVSHLLTLWRLVIMCFGGSCCSANVLIKNARHTGSRLRAIAFAACCYIGSSALRLAILYLFGYFRPITLYTTNRNFGFNKKIVD